MSQPGDDPPPPIVVEHEQKKFDKMVNFYFPGNEAFVTTEGALRPLGTSISGTTAVGNDIRFTEWSGYVMSEDGCVR